MLEMDRLFLNRMRFTMCVRGTSCGNEPGLIRPDRCDLSIQIEAAIREFEHYNHESKITYLNNGKFVIDIDEYTSATMFFGVYEVHLTVYILCDI